MRHKCARACARGCGWVFTVVSHQALLDVTDICKKVADCCDLAGKKRSHAINGNRSNHPATSHEGDSYPRSAGGGDEVVAPLIAQFNAVSAEARHAA